MLLLQFLLVGVAQLGVFDFLDLERQHVDLLSHVLVVAVQLPSPGVEGGHCGVGRCVPVTLFPQVAERIKDIELKLLAEQGLVIVGSVHIHEQVADLPQGLDRGGAVVDEDLSGARGRDDAPDHKRAVLAGRQSEIFEDRVDSFRVGKLERCFDAALVFPGADHAAVGAVAENETERADKDGFARAGFPRDDVESFTELNAHVLHDREVLDA